MSSVSVRRSARSLMDSTMIGAPLGGLWGGSASSAVAHLRRW